MLFCIAFVFQMTGWLVTSFHLQRLKMSYRHSLSWLEHLYPYVYVTDDGRVTKMSPSGKRNDLKTAKAPQSSLEIVSVENQTFKQPKSLMYFTVGVTMGTPSPRLSDISN